MDGWTAAYLDRMPSGPKLASDLLARMAERAMTGGRHRSLAYHAALLAQEAGALLVLLRSAALEGAGAGEGPLRAAAETRVPVRRHARAMGRLAKAAGLPAEGAAGRAPGPDPLGEWWAELAGLAEATGAAGDEAAALVEEARAVAAGCARLLWLLDRAAAEPGDRRALEALLAEAAQDWGPRGPVYERLFGGRGGPACTGGCAGRRRTAGRRRRPRPTPGRARSGRRTSRPRRPRGRASREAGTRPGRRRGPGSRPSGG